MKGLLFSVVVVLLGLQGCVECTKDRRSFCADATCTPPTYRFPDPEIVDYLAPGKVGSWWKYVEERTGKVDCMYVKSYDRHIGNGVNFHPYKYPDCTCNKMESVDVDYGFNQDPKKWADLRILGPYKGKGCNGIEPGSVDFWTTNTYNYIADFRTIFYFDSNKYFDEKLNQLVINSNVYEDVIMSKSRFSTLEGEKYTNITYFKKGIGLIKYIIHDTTYSLISYSIK